MPEAHTKMSCAASQSEITPIGNAQAQVQMSNKGTSEGQAGDERLEGLGRTGLDGVDVEATPVVQRRRVTFKEPSPLVEGQRPRNLLLYTPQSPMTATDTASTSSPLPLVDFSASFASLVLPVLHAHVCSTRIPSPAHTT